MLSDYKVFDGHCDSVTIKNLLHTKGQLRICDMEKYPGYIQVFAICAVDEPAYSFVKHHIKRYDRLVHNWRLEKILSKNDLKNASYGAILALEGADALHSSVSALRRFYNMGVRLLTLTWNHNNAVASSIESQVDNGLCDFGRKIVKECENLGVVIDLSHIGVKGFYDVAEIAQKPFVCSHSNSRAVYEHKRGLTDDQFKILVKKGGVSGINFAPYFLGENAGIEDIVRHIEHFCSLGGEKSIGLGSDFDGIEYMPRGCSGADFMTVIAEALLKNNYREETVRDILYGNFYRVFREILK